MVEVNFKNTNQTSKRVIISNLKGQVVYDNEIGLTGKSNITLDLSKFGRGAYIVNCQSDNYRIVYKIIVS